MTSPFISPASPSIFLLAFCTIAFKWSVCGVFSNATSKSGSEKQGSCTVGKLKCNWHTNKCLDSNFNTTALMCLVCRVSLSHTLIFWKPLGPAQRMNQEWPPVLQQRCLKGQRLCKAIADVGDTLTGILDLWLCLILLKQGKYHLPNEC